MVSLWACDTWFTWLHRGGEAIFHYELKKKNLSAYYIKILVYGSGEMDQMWREFTGPCEGPQLKSQHSVIPGPNTLDSQLSVIQVSKSLMLTFDLCRNL